MNENQQNYYQQLKVEQREIIELLRAFDKQKQPNSALHVQIRRKLSRIEAALERIQVGSYGLCLICGQPISQQRLYVLAYAESCLVCQQKKESA